MVEFFMAVVIAITCGVMYLGGMARGEKKKRKSGASIFAPFTFMIGVVGICAVSTAGQGFAVEQAVPRWVAGSPL